MATGRVKFFNDEKGYGFITSEKSGHDVFVHISSLQQSNTLREGEKVSFEIGQDRDTGKLQAEKVTVL
ncbi:cold-shock protein [Agrobacterium tumefaciens]|uniref:Cold-shock protein n=1 Tax=Agrobacterium tumefaciens TaxID=358 RepID=A0A0D0KHB7_AGRTU|nr:cold-shock protein [Agrobacterium tumefaciens]